MPGCANRCAYELNHDVNQNYHACAAHANISRYCGKACVIGECGQASGTHISRCPHICTRNPNHAGVHTCSHENHSLLATGLILRSQHNSWFLSRADDDGPYESQTQHTFVLESVPGQRDDVVKVRHVATGTYLNRDSGGRGWFHGRTPGDQRLWLFRVIRIQNLGNRKWEWGVALESLLDTHHVNLVRGGSLCYQVISTTCRQWRMVFST